MKKEKQVLFNQVKLLSEKDEAKEKEPNVGDPEKMKEPTEKKILPIDTLLFDQPWFHAELTREDAEMLLDDYQHIPGAFLVRETTRSIHCAISFIFRRMCNHVMIHQKLERDNMKFYLHLDLKFDSIIELIEYYRQYPIITLYFSQVLTIAVPKIDAYEARPWFNYVSKMEAELMLKSDVSLDGTFLVRPSSQGFEDGKEAFAITLRANDKIHHIRIIKDREQFTIGGDTFDSLIELIYYYKYQPIYHGTKLAHPINKEILEQKNPHWHPYDSIKEPPVTVCASYDFKATGANELSFQRGALITNVEKMEGGLWIGEYKGSRGWFPASYVREIQIS
ncbi:PREDICTED: 1-phosphatidylinositol 4,5-bisphosphate phosphodiesterase gamma-1-like isoform X2 [Amphimedon queenslandica]|uniref:SH2 domain-containing protein n=1 Tax=Amphimedon queenslandica TaxID=400682 RepID=A0AAN0JE43_AMPQE|nr:PREDICTED: 1-phosphatidylinositol 4,5-bisphosphate phosphodiesterase gamma-1-like isoform X2 [Amphimedon queenslandica]|eukprot:XP_019854983.1 PREDICTED: 1-phosphatidylinositol 4,5-bisphosphate phosphodiesterase gamma-1-like isoform X2 [Amphimedon queenslandica]